MMTSAPGSGFAPRPICLSAALVLSTCATAASEVAKVRSERTLVVITRRSMKVCRRGFKRRRVQRPVNAPQSLLPRRRMFLEKLRDERGRLRLEFVSARMDERHERRAALRFVDEALLVPRLALGLAAVEFAHRLHRGLLPFVLYERVRVAGEVHRGLRFQLSNL